MHALLALGSVSKHYLTSGTRERVKHVKLSNEPNKTKQKRLNCTELLLGVFSCSCKSYKTNLVHCDYQVDPNGSLQFFSYKMNYNSLIYLTIHYFKTSEKFEIIKNRK